MSWKVSYKKIYLDNGEIVKGVVRFNTKKSAIKFQNFMEKTSDKKPGICPMTGRKWKLLKK